MPKKPNAKQMRLLPPRQKQRLTQLKQLELRHLRRLNESKRPKSLKQRKRQRKRGWLQRRPPGRRSRMRRSYRLNLPLIWPNRPRRRPNARRPSKSRRRQLLPLLLPSRRDSA